MEEVSYTDSKHTEDIPNVPIKTYQWEDVRRARKRGGYPWTHLTKPPFDEEADVEMYTMDAFRRSRSSSTLGKPDKSETHDIPDDISIKSTTEEVTPLELKNHKNDVSKPEGTDTTTIKREQDFINDAVEGPTKDKNVNKENLLPVARTNNQGIRASSEEPSKKRKLSIESSHSRISFSKLAFIDKFKGAKDKLKIPKLVKRSKSDVLESKKPKVRKTEKKLNNQMASEPVYIHIPLKLPPGETDEYSKYEFESPGPSSHSASLTQLSNFGSGKRKLSLLGLLTELKKVHDQQVLASESKHDHHSDGRESRRIRLKETHSSRTSLDELKIEDVTDTINSPEAEKSAQQIKDLVLEAATASAPDSYSMGSNISQYLDNDDKYEIIATEIPNLDIDCVIITELDEPSPSVITQKANLNELPEWTRFTPDRDAQNKVRSKSEEPKRKRKPSIDSSYSRKSLSKLVFLKKLKEAKNSIKLPKFLSFTKSDNKKSKHIQSTEKLSDVTKKPEVKKMEHGKHGSPLYIHIPLKLPKGHIDEFSHLSKVEVKSKPDIKVDEIPEVTPECETPITPNPPENNIQLIILTPPSDDEILDSNTPETPSESDDNFLEKVDELKSLAKKAVDVVYPDKKQLEAVLEDSNHEDNHQNGIGIEGETTYWQMQPVLVDVEDGLKLSDTAIAMINEEMAKELEVEKSNMKPELTTQLKKKVSFKKVRAQDGERIYEDVGLPSVTTNLQATPLETFRSMSADEEKFYLNANVIKTTSLDEDYNKWSKITDHEYEPVNPPPEDIQMLDEMDPKINLTSNSTDGQQKHITFMEQPHKDSIPENLNQTSIAEEFQNEIEDRFFKPAEVPLPNTNTGVVHQETVTLPTLPIKPEPKKKEKPNKKSSTRNNFNTTIRLQADKIKNKLQNIKKPNITLPQRPKFSSATFPKVNFKKPTFTVPKMPEMPSLKFASFSLGRKDNAKTSWQKRQYSTESNAGDSKTKKFDFRTYPRIFDKTKKVKTKSFDDTTPSPVFATVPRTSRAKSLPEPGVEYTETEDLPKEYYYDKSRGFVTIPIDPASDNTLHMPSHIRYNDDINIDDGFDGDQNGSELHQVPLDRESSLADWHKRDLNRKHNYLSSDMNGDAGETHSDRSSGSLSEHRQGVLEEIDSDQFFLREKGISQDDIDVGKYLSSEIKEAFKNPINALTQLRNEDREYDIDITDQSQSSEEAPKRKWLKKPKRKKTPHVSNEQLSFECGSDPEDYVPKQIVEEVVLMPTRPKRRSKKSKKRKSEFEEVIPYQETIPFEEHASEQLDFIDDEEQSFELEESNLSPNTFMNHEEPKTMIPLYMNTPNDEFDVTPTYINTLDFDAIPDLKPVPPIRKNKSVRSLDYVEEDLNMDQKSTNGFEVSRPEHIFETQQIQETIPVRPSRKSSHVCSESVASLQDEQRPSDVPPIRPLRFRSRTQSESLPSLQDTEILQTGAPPIRPTRLRSRTISQSTESIQDKGSRDFDSLVDNSWEIPCTEEPCIQVLCDKMGYAVIDKRKMRDPPLPPSRFPKTPPRTRRKRTPAKEGRFATVPRPPARPLRNYSTLGHSSSPSKSNVSIFDDDKENENLNPYIEIDEDEIAHRLQSGEVIQKMRERPLPAPPRPPRKARTPNRDVFRDISHERNLPSSDETIDVENQEMQKDPLIFVNSPGAQLLELEQQILTDDHEETVTHAALVVKPLNKSIVLPHYEFSNPDMELSIGRILVTEQEREFTNNGEEVLNMPVDELISNDPMDSESFEKPSKITIPENTITLNQTAPTENSEDDEDETSEVPKEFYDYKDPDIQEHEVMEDTREAPKEFYNYKDTDTAAQKIQENDQCVGNLKLQVLDVDKLTVNEIMANKIVVSELEGASINVSEINSKSGNLVISGIELPHNIVKEVLDGIRLTTQPQDSRTTQCVEIEKEDEQDHLQRLVQQDTLVTTDDVGAPPVPPRNDSISNLLDMNLSDNKAPSDEQLINPTEGNIEGPLPPSSLNTLQSQIEVVDIIGYNQDEPPVRPPRRASQADKQIKDVNLDDYVVSPESIIAQTECNLDLDTIEKNEEKQVLLVLSESSILEDQSANVDQFLITSPVVQQVSPDTVDRNRHTDLYSDSIIHPQLPQLTPEHEAQYFPSQPPLHFYNLRSPLGDDFNENNIPFVQCRMCRHKYSTLSRSSSTEELSPRQPRPRRLSEPSIPHLAGELVQSCASELDRSFRYLITWLTETIFHNAEGKQDLQVMFLMLIILIASLILIGGDGRVTEHHHHWEYFNPPRNL